MAQVIIHVSIFVLLVHSWQFYATVFPFHLSLKSTGVDCCWLGINFFLGRWGGGGGSSTRAQHTAISNYCGITFCLKIVIFMLYKGQPSRITIQKRVRSISFFMKCQKHYQQNKNIKLKT